ncbi:SPOR domain-containing protein [Vannielia litorea]|uniref:SPOR domain-containing protein n=1 Tax=Vannielia litorea TaxID=1217970 RepID=UPI001BCC92FF|nr:SPOR domain-containing protein [Vannielia litorea]MBS8225466.1 SPOR domain-containing protein [Vannielia litorea]
MGKGKLLHVGVISVSVLALAACEDGAGLNFGGKKADGPATAAVDRPATTKLVERDVEAPEVFSKNEDGLWDGRPSLGGVWIAHPDVKEPERVIIRNETNGKFVIGALFKRERENPGPKLQVSSDAANALGVLPGAPTKLDVVALVREEVPEAAPAAAPAATEADAIAAPEAIEQKSLDAPLASAEAAIARAEGTGDASADTEAGTPAVETASAAAAAEPKAKKGFWQRLRGKKARRAKADATISAAADAAPPVAPSGVATPEISAAPLAPTAAAATSAAPKAAGPKPSGGKNYVQIGIFSVEDNANRTAAEMRKSGVVPTVFEQKSAGKTFWRVVIGPAHSAADRDALLKKVKAMGFQDAYFVTN